MASDDAPALPAPARRAAEAAYRNWRIGGDGEGRLHAALLAYAAAVQAGADQSLTDRMAAMEETIRASERERIRRLAGAVGAHCEGDGIEYPFADLLERGPEEPRGETP